MKAKGTFVPRDFLPQPIEVPVKTALPAGVMTMKKVYSGEIIGESFTLFCSAFDQKTNTGTYVAMESFIGALGDRHGAFNYIHLADSQGGNRTNELLRIVPHSGTGELAGIRGGGTMTIEEDGTHRIELEYEL